MTRPQQNCTVFYSNYCEFLLTYPNVLEKAEAIDRGPAPLDQNQERRLEQSRSKRRRAKPSRVNAVDKRAVIARSGTRDIAQVRCPIRATDRRTVEPRDTCGTEALEFAFVAVICTRTVAARIFQV